MELLIVKCESDYIRFKKGQDLLVKLDKASVFPMDKMNEVKEHVSRLEREGFTNVCIKKLVLTEEDI